jgi:phosphoserine aminotransferase
MHARSYNFGAGPAALPGPVLDRIAEDLAGARDDGPSMLEASHRSDAFGAVAERAEAGLRDVMGIPDHYRVLFLQGGATLQFSAVPLNLTSEGSIVDHVVTGVWSRRAADEAARFCRVNIAADGSAGGYAAIPDPDSWALTPDAAYVAYTPNETINGVEFSFIPDTGLVPLVADMSSSVLSRPIDVSRFGLIYAGAQKNLGIAGLTIVIVRDDLIGSPRPGTPTILDYGSMAAAGSMLNTPPTFAWYVAALVIDWVRAEGGVAAMAERNEAQKDRLYTAIDASEMYENRVDPSCRSWMNVPFQVAGEAAEAFLDEATGAGLLGLRGHRSLGGMRASLYNAMPDEGVDALVDFMAGFEQRRRAGAGEAAAR